MIEVYVPFGQEQHVNVSYTPFLALVNNIYINLSKERETDRGRDRDEEEKVALDGKLRNNTLSKLRWMRDPLLDG